VFSTDFPPKYQSWDAVDPASLFTAPVVKVENKGNIVRHLEDEAGGVTVLILWLDCDRVGTVVVFLVWMALTRWYQRPGGRKHLFRGD
jgi:DNA topoisomerase III